MTQTTRMMPQQTRDLSVLPQTLNEENRSVEVVWSSGASVRRYDWNESRYYDEVLVVSSEACDLTRLNNGAPVLDAHSQYELRNVIGVVEKAWLTPDGEGRAIIRMSPTAEDEPVWQKAKTGIIRNISIATASLLMRLMIVALPRSIASPVGNLPKSVWCPLGPTPGLGPGHQNVTRPRATS